MKWTRMRIFLALLALAAILFLGSGALTHKPQTEKFFPTYSIMHEEDILPRNTASERNARNIVQNGDGQDILYSHAQPFSSSAPRGATGVLPANPNPENTSDFPPAQAGTETKTARTTLGSLFDNPYAFIPRGLINTAAPKQKSRTPEEQELYEYGNAVGAEIQMFESAHKNATETLKNFFPEKGGFSADDPIAVAAVLALAGDYSRLGGTIANISFVPESAQELHMALAKSYEGVGDGLSSLAKTPANGDITKAVLAYDEKADVFIKNFVALAEFFSARGIKFSPSDPGSMFQFGL